MKASWQLLLPGGLWKSEALSPVDLGLEESQFCLIQSVASKRSPPVTAEQLPELLLDAALLQQSEKPLRKEQLQQNQHRLQTNLPRVRIKAGPSHSRIQLTDQNHGLVANNSARSHEMNDVLSAAASPSLLQDSVSQREAAFFKEQARQAKFEVDQLKAAGQRLLAQDELVRQQDESLRTEEVELRHENRHLEEAIRKLSRGAGLSSIDSGDAPEVAAILTALAAVPAEADNATAIVEADNSSSNSTANSHSTASAAEQTKKVLLISGSALALFILWASIHLCLFFRKGTDYDGDGEIDWADFEEHMARRVCCGMNAPVAKGVLAVFTLAALGFAFLWWQGIIQPFLKELTCYAYFGIVAAAIVGVIVAEIWADLNRVFDTQFSAINKLVKLFNLGDADERKVGNQGEQPTKRQRGCC